MWTPPHTNIIWSSLLWLSRHQKVFNLYTSKSRGRIYGIMQLWGKEGGITNIVIAKITEKKQLKNKPKQFVHLVVSLVQYVCFNVASIYYFQLPVGNLGMEKLGS